MSRCSLHHPAVPATADALDKCLSVLKPTGHYAHIQNLGTDPAVMQRLRQQHEAGRGPSVSHIFVTPNGAQLAEVLQLMEDGKVKLEVAKVSRPWGRSWPTRHAGGRCT